MMIVGYHKFEIFRHVPQSTLMSAEPGMERRWAKIRMDASMLSICVHHVYQNVFD